MQPTLLTTLLLALLSTSLIATDSSRILGNCGEGCLACSSSNICSLCADDMMLNNGVCVEPYVYNGIVAYDTDHFSWVDIDNSGVDIPVIVIGAICAAAVYIASAILMYRQDWKAWVPEVKEEAKNATATPKEPAKTSTPKGDKVIEMGEINGQTASTKTGTPSSPERKANSPTRPRVNQEEEEEQHLERTANVQVQEVDEEDEEPYYPNQRELETRSKPARRHHQEEEEEEEQGDEEEVEIEVHDGEDEDEARTAQETPSPKTEFRSSQRPSSNKKSHKRNDSNHSDAEEVDSPQHHRAQNNQHDANEGEEEEEEEEEEFESARSKHASNEEEEEEEQEEQEEEEDDEPQEIMDLNDLGLDAAKKQTHE